MTSIQTEVLIRHFHDREDEGKLKPLYKMSVQKFFLHIILHTLTPPQGRR
jgi:hypothetical protein